MFGYEILRNQWVVAVLFTAIAMILYVAVFYLDLWQPRRYKKKGDQKEYETSYLSVWSGIPWSIKILIFFSTIYAVVYSVYAILEPKSW